MHTRPLAVDVPQLAVREPGQRMVGGRRGAPAAPGPLDFPDEEDDRFEDRREPRRRDSEYDDRPRRKRGMSTGANIAIFGGIASLVGASTERDVAPVAPIIGGVGMIICAFLICMGVPGLVAGVGLLKFKPWARMLGIVISALDLISVPFGTALGVYGLWVLLSHEGEMLFKNQIGNIRAGYMKTMQPNVTADVDTHPGGIDPPGAQTPALDEAPRQPPTPGSPEVCLCLSKKPS